MDRKSMKIDLIKLIRFFLKRSWFIVLFAEIGFGAFYIYTTRFVPDTYTASGMMYVNNGSPNLANYQYTNTNDLDTAVQLIDTYRIVVKSNKVMSAVTQQLKNKYPEVTSKYIASTMGLQSVSETGVVSVSSCTNNAQLSADIVNTVLDIVPAEIIRVVEAGNIEIIDYAVAPLLPDYKSGPQRGLLGGLVGAFVACGALLTLFMFNRRVTDAEELTENYTPPVLASIKRVNMDNPQADSFLINDQSQLEVIENYAKLRMNLLYTLANKSSNTVIMASAVSGEGKSTIAANLAISCAMGGKKVVLIDGDLRRACQKDIFRIEGHIKGLSEVLLGISNWHEVIIKNVRQDLDIIPAGYFPPNPAELLSTQKMQSLLNELEREYDLVLLDMPPVNIVADPLVVSTNVAGCLFIVRQDYTDHRDIRQALIAAEMTGMDVLGFVFYGENLNQGGYYSRKYYSEYYGKYDYRKPAMSSQENIVMDVTSDQG